MNTEGGVEGASTGRPSWGPVRRGTVVLVYVAVFLVLLPGVHLAAGLQMDRFVAWELPDLPLIGGLGVALSGAGLFVMAHAALQCALTGRGLPVSHLPPDRLVTGGIYRHVRHPIYTGFIAVITGVGMFLRSPGVLLVGVPLLVTAVAAYVRVYEEPGLLRRFGEPYRRYATITPRMLPSLGRPRGEATADGANAGLLRAAERLANATVLFRAGPAIFVTYGLLCAVGLTIALWIMAVYLRANGVGSAAILLFSAGIVLAGLVGARLFWWIRHAPSVLHRSWFGLRETGFVSWGAIAALVVFSFSFVRATGHPALLMTDSLFGSLMIGYAIGRLGCLTYGCCWGTPAGRRGIRYVNPASRIVRERGGEGILRHPVQLYSALHGLAIFTVLTGVAFTRPALGFVTALGFILYGWGRFVIEFRRDQERIGRTPFGRGHLGALASFVAGWAVLLGIRPEAAEVFEPLSREAAGDVLGLVPAVFGLGLVIFVAMGLHWKRLGSW